MDKWKSIHSFRSGFYCQSILNAEKKSVNTSVMKELAQIIAGWKTTRDRSHY